MNVNVNEVEANEVTDRDLLAVVYKVERLEAIPNKDRIELVHLKDCGYTCICEKGHTVGDLVVFIKYDTILPKIEMFNWMAESKYRVKPKSFTERDEEDNVVKKIYSQGIVIPFRVVSEYIECDDINIRFEGADLTSYLGIVKYIAPVSNGGMGNMQSKGDFPTHKVSKTDEMNVCSKMKAYAEIQGQEVYITQKIEGSSVTFFCEDDELVVCSRNNILIETEGNKFWQGVKKYDTKTLFTDLPWLICQAELYGPGIQKNKLGTESVDIMIFNMIDGRTRQKLGYYRMIDIAVKYKLPLVPLICCIQSFDWTFEQLQEFTDKQKYPNGELAEGVVIRPVEPFISKVLHEEWSLKCISREYKL